MFQFLLSLFAKLGIALLSFVIGVAGFVTFQVMDRAKAEPAPLPAPEPAMQWRQTASVEIRPKLLALTEDPVDLCGDALDVLYVLERDGHVVRIAPGTDRLSVSTRYGSLSTDQTHPEIGFSAIAFHPDFLVEGSVGYGRFYVLVSELAGSGRPDFTPRFGGGAEHHQDVIYEYVSEHPLAATFRGTRREVIRFSQPGRDHNVTSLEFDARGYLFIAVGDGAIAPTSRQSPSKNASSLTSAYGKVLRIDPLGNDGRNARYGIPETNPFRLVTEALPELWTFGLRSPHSLSFDALRDSLYFSEVAVGTRDRIHRSELGGEHYGWDLDQASFLVSLTMRRELEEIVTNPLLQIDRSYGHVGATSGALVYRGEAFPSLAGRLIFATDDGQLLATSTAAEASDPISIPLGPIERKSIRALRTTPRGEMVLLCGDGSVTLLSKGPPKGLERSPERSLYAKVTTGLFPAFRSDRG